jgi:meso-butanediol dehydrogenase/(S,S)-butanediol dehydrogenase/diacetyl reductase
VDQLIDKVAIVTGAGSGIGRATAQRFAAEGAAVIVADVRLGKAAETVDAITAAAGRATAVQVDVRRAEEVGAMVQTALDTYGGLHVLFNNAGTLRPGDAVKLSEEDWHVVMDTNVTSVFLGVKYAVPPMAAGGGGSIISTASVSGLHGDPGSIAYGASKAAVINLTRCMAVDHARQNIRVNCICPGAIDTPPVGRMLAQGDSRDRTARAHLLGRIGRAEEIAAAALWLASDESSFVTGHELVVDGGLTARSHLGSIGDPRPAHRRG